MGWRWRKSMNLGGGASTTVTSRGVGVSWGLAGFRLGRSPSGALWASFTVPGTGISFFKYLSSEKQSLPLPPQTPSIPQSVPPAQLGPPPPSNQWILDEMKRSKP